MSLERSGDYINCLLEYQGQIDDFEEGKDEEAVLEVFSIREQLEELQEQGLVRQINYGNTSVRHGERVSAVPVSFELDVETYTSKSLDSVGSMYGIERSDRWDYKPVSSEPVMPRNDTVLKSNEQDAVIGTDIDSVERRIGELEDVSLLNNKRRGNQLEL